LVVAAAAVGLEDSRDDGSFAQSVSVDCGAKELYGYGLRRSAGLQTYIK
jgi:hypothetical protein